MSVIGTELAAQNLDAAAMFPTLTSVKSSLYRSRHKAYLALPGTIAAMDLPADLRSTLNGEEFLKWSRPDNGILLFTTNENLNMYDLF